MPAQGVTSTRAVSIRKGTIVHNSPSDVRPARYAWRMVDIMSASLIGVVFGVIFWAWGLSWDGVSSGLAVSLPGSQAALAAVWLMPAVLAPLLVRKPGAAIYAELLAAFVSMVIGSQWGWTVLLSGVVQGLGAEAVFALLAYRAYSLWPAVAAGVGSAVFMAVNDLTVWFPAYEWSFKLVYGAAAVMGGALIAGLGSWAIARALVQTGAVRALAAGIAAQRTITPAAGSRRE